MVGACCVAFAERSPNAKQQAANQQAVIHTHSMNDEPIRVLVIDDEQAHAEVIAEGLERVGYECVIATSGSAGAKRIEQEEFDVVLTDLRMEDMDGLAILRKAKQESPDSEVVVITGFGDVKTAVEAIKQGAANYLTKPVAKADLLAACYASSLSLAVQSGLHSIAFPAISTGVYGYPASEAATVSSRSVEQFERTGQAPGRSGDRAARPRNFP